MIVVDSENNTMLLHNTIKECIPFKENELNELAVQRNSTNIIADNAKKIHHMKVYAEITGEEFNRIFQGLQFVKLTNYCENHNGFEFKEGLNSDTKQFNPNGNCSSGGMYFIKKENIHKWIWYAYHVRMMWWVRSVTIPDDARVYVENGKFKTNKFMLGKRKLIKEKYYIEAIKCTKYNVLPHLEMGILTKNVCMAGVKRNGLFLIHVPIQHIDEDMCKESIKQNFKALQYVPNEFKEKIKDYIFISH